MERTNEGLCVKGQWYGWCVEWCQFTGVSSLVSVHWCQYTGLTACRQLLLPQSCYSQISYLASKGLAAACVTSQQPVSVQKWLGVAQPCKVRLRSTMVER